VNGFFFSLYGGFVHTLQRHIYMQTLLQKYIFHPIIWVTTYRNHAFDSELRMLQNAPVNWEHFHHNIKECFC